MTKEERRSYWKHIVEEHAASGLAQLPQLEG